MMVQLPQFLLDASDPINHCSILVLPKLFSLLRHYSPVDISITLIEFHLFGSRVKLWLLTIAVIGEMRKHRGLEGVALPFQFILHAFHVLSMSKNVGHFIRVHCQILVHWRQQDELMGVLHLDSLDCI